MPGCGTSPWKGRQEAVSLQDIFWVVEKPPVGLAIVLRPPGDDQNKSYLEHLKKSGIDTLVSMLDPTEAICLGLEEEEVLAQAAGLQFLSYPVLDVHVPAVVESFRAFVSDLAARLGAGERIGIHCRGSIGRSTVTAACAMIHLGWKAKDALKAIEEARGYPVPDTKQQEKWIKKYKAAP